MDDSFKKAVVAVPKLSGFDKSHQNILTSKVGTITPILCDELIPGTKVNLKLAISASLPPLASDTFMRCSIKTEAFFCPLRLLDAGFEAFFTDEEKGYLTYNSSTGIGTTNAKALMPVIKDTTSAVTPPSGSFATFTQQGSLADYLGFKSNSAFIKTGVTALPFLAYHRIYSDHYRNSLVQKECFLPAKTSVAPNVLNFAATSPYAVHDSSSYIWSTEDSLTLADGNKITDLRQRNFGLDYFTTGTPNPQQGSAMTISFGTDVNGDGSSSSFSIAALRAANSMQQFKERNNLLGNLYVEQCYGRYGVRPSDEIAQRSLYLGRGEFEVYSKGIYETSNHIEGGSSEPSTIPGQKNPFASVAARYGSAYASGDNFHIHFEAKEPGYLFVMATLVPRVTYSSGVRRYLKHYIGAGSLADMANPILQNVGPQPIYRYELSNMVLNDTDVFAYTDRFGEFKTMEDELHGLLRDGQSLEAFALQRTITGTNIGMNSNFLQIPTDYMDKVTAVKEWLSDFGYWLDCFFDYKVAMPLSKYSLPSLQDPAYEHGKNVVVSKGGSRL